jgi:hypothetical protein
MQNHRATLAGDTYFELYTRNVQMTEIAQWKIHPTTAKFHRFSPLELCKVKVGKMYGSKEPASSEPCSC